MYDYIVLSFYITYVDHTKQQLNLSLSEVL
jgi:hypothetical protein